MSFADISTLRTGPTFLGKSIPRQVASSLSHETETHARGVLVFARRLALRDARLPITHGRNAFFFALGPRRFAAARTYRAGWFRRIVRRFVRNGCSRIDNEKHGRGRKRCRWFRNGFCRMRLIRRERFRRAVVGPATKLPHPRFGVFDAIARLSKRIKLQPLVPTRGANGRFDLARVIERHAVFKAHVPFVERMDTRSTCREARQSKRSQSKRHRPR